MFLDLVKRNIEPIKKSIPKNTIITLSMGALIALGITLMVLKSLFGSRLPHHPEAWTQQWYFDHLGDIGRLLIIGGMLGAVNRFMQAVGMFREAIADVVVRDEFLNIRNDLPDLWYRLTQRIYLRNFASDEGPEADLSHRVRSAIEHRLMYDEQFFLRNVRRSLTITWHDENKGIIKVEENLTFEIVPFTGTKPVIWKSVFSPTSGLNIEDYHREVTELKVEGMGKVEEEEEDGKKITKVHLSGRNYYDATRKSIKSWSILEDPYVLYTSPYVIDGAMVVITCIAGGLSTTFIGLGVEKQFENYIDDTAATYRRGDQNRVCRSVILPDQGYMIVFQRLAEAADEPTMPGAPLRAPRRMPLRP